MSKGKYEKLLEWWVRGLTIDWKHLYGEHLPRRISLPTYPFARERYWVPTVGTCGGAGDHEGSAGHSSLPTCARLLPTGSLAEAVTSPSPIESVHPRTSEASPLSITQPEAETSPPVEQGAQTTNKTNENGKAPRTGASPASTNRVALRPLADHPMLLSGGMDDRKGSVECSCLPASPWEADQPQPPITPSLSGQSFSHSRSN